MWATDISGSSIPNPIFEITAFNPSHTLKNTDKSESKYALDGKYYSYRESTSFSLIK